MDKHGSPPKKAQTKHAEPLGVSKGQTQDTSPSTSRTGSVTDHKTVQRSPTKGR